MPPAGPGPVTSGSLPVSAGGGRDDTTPAHCSTAGLNRAAALGQGAVAGARLQSALRADSGAALSAPSCKPGSEPSERDSGHSGVDQAL